MVEFGGRYYIDPAQVEYISETDRAGAIVADSHPYDLTVHLLSGKSLGLCYPNKAARDNERRKLVTAIQREKTNPVEATHLWPTEKSDQNDAAEGLQWAGISVLS